MKPFECTFNTQWYSDTPYCCPARRTAPHTCPNNCPIVKLNVKAAQHYEQQEAEKALIWKEMAELRALIDKLRKTVGVQADQIMEIQMLTQNRGR